MSSGSGGRAGQTGPRATRGLTTLQLLELAVVGLTKLYTRQGQAPTVTENVNGVQVTRQIDLAQSSLVSDRVATQLGISLPKGTKMHVMDKLVKAGWFQDGRGQGENARPFRATSAEGQQIEAKRAQIYDLASAVVRELAEPSNYKAHVVGGVQRAPAGSGELEPLLRSSYSWGNAKKGQTLQSRINALQQVWQLTDRNQEPPAPARTGGGAGFGAPRPASRANADLEIGQSAGFLNRNVVKFLSRHINKRATRQPTQVQLDAANRFGQALRQALGLGGQFNLSEVQQGLLNRFGPTGQGVKQLFDAVVQQLGGAPAAGQTMWEAASTSSIKELIGGFNINKPNWQTTDGKARKDFVHVVEAQGANPEGNAAEFTRYVYNQLFVRYVQGQGVDRQSNEAAAKSNRRTNVGARGLLGTDDAALKNLTANNARQVASFIGKARKGFYTLEALRAGAQKMGIQIDPGVIVHDAVIQTLVDQVVRGYSSGIGVDADKTLAVAAALNITGFGTATRGIRDQATLLAARDAILRKLDAQSGHLTAPCTAANYKRRDLKRIAKAHGVKTDKIKTVAGACAALAAAGVNPEQPSQDAISSGRRQELATAARPSQAKSGRRSGRRSPTILEGLAGTNFSPGRAQNLAAFMGGQQAQQFQPQQPAFQGGGITGQVQPLSGSFSPGGTRRATQGQPLNQFQQAPGLTLGGGVAPSVVSTQPQAGGGLAFPTATGGVQGNVNPLLNLF